MKVWGFPGDASGKEPAGQCGRCKEMWVLSLGWKDTLEEGTAINSVFLPGDSFGQRSLADYSP